MKKEIYDFYKFKRIPIHQMMKAGEDNYNLKKKYVKKAAKQVFYTLEIELLETPEITWSHLNGNINKHYENKILARNQFIPARISRRVYRVAQYKQSLKNGNEPRLKNSFLGFIHNKKDALVNWKQQSKFKNRSYYFEQYNFDSQEKEKDFRLCLRL